MKIKIDKGGQLFISRNEGEFKLQRCPYNSNNVPCGEQCAKLGEVMNHTGSQEKLQICGSRWLYSTTKIRDEDGN